MARFRNVSGEGRTIPEGVPQTVADGDVFTVPDERADAFADQPYFEPAEAGSSTKRAAKSADNKPSEG